MSTLSTWGKKHIINAFSIFAFLFLFLPSRVTLSQDSSWVTQTNIYQVFVEKFGGTLKGVESHLDHLQYLGVKTIWLMPVFESMSDHGYDTTNYYAIKTNYGSINDLRDLVKAANEKGMKVILDLVINHAGSNHPWFSSNNLSERKDRWFTWSSNDKGWPEPWGGGDTWSHDPLSNLDRDHNGNDHDDDFFYTVFGSTMPDLNYNNVVTRKELIDEFTKVMRFWIKETGVAGFRCDAVRYLVENGPDPNARKDQPETHKIWKTLRANLKEIDPQAILLAEAPTETYEQMRSYYGSGDEFHTAFHFMYQGVLMSTLIHERRPSNLLKDLYAIQSSLPAGTQDTIFLSNHDSFAGARAASQLGGNIAKMKSVASLYLLLSGNPAIYYGEEIGMQGAGSDSALRQPMDFTSAANQKADPDSLLNHYTRLLRVRNRYEALRGGITYFVKSSDGGWDCMDCEANRMAIIREYFGEKILVVHNFTSNNLDVHLDLTKLSTGLDIPDGTPVNPLMGGGNFPNINSSNKSFYPLGTLFGFTTKVLFLGDIPQKYRDAMNNYLTYESALEKGGEKPRVAFTCENGQTVFGLSVYVVGETDEIGNWDTKKAIKLDPTDYPTWTGTIPLPPNRSISWKCIIRNEQSPFDVKKWEPDPDNIVNTPSSGTISARGTL
ncbi:MAG TPA: alpha-amylase family glycosyl hydrolase [Candidatus Competibacteraceae bacterium]|nr:alpha-amylase family glycosyl hydrolase [Candidatus Competibacteraceae bacterium]